MKVEVVIFCSSFGIKILHLWLATGMGGWRAKIYCPSGAAGGSIQVHQHHRSMCTNHFSCSISLAIMRYFSQWLYNDYTVIFLLFFSISLKKHKNCGAVGGLIQVHHHPGSPCFLIWWPPKNWLSKHIHFTRVTRDGFYEEDRLQFQNICRMRFQRLLHNTLTWVWFFSTWWTNENTCLFV